MSLKAVHIFFITVATLAAAGFGLWLVRHYLATGNGLDLFLAILALVGALALPIYGAWFLKKMKKVGYV